MILIPDETVQAGSYPVTGLLCSEAFKPSETMDSDSTSPPQSSLTHWIGSPMCIDCKWKLGTEITNNCSCTGRGDFKKYEEAIKIARSLQAQSPLKQFSFSQRTTTANAMQDQQHPQQPAPDFGEPWKATDYHFITSEGNFSTGVLASLYRNRIAACVNACASMRDPAAEIQALRDAVKEAHDAFEDLMGLIPDVPPWAHTEAKLALAKLKALA